MTLAMSIDAGAEIACCPACGQSGGQIMQVLRTPDDRFAGLADYPFAPHYCDDRERRRAGAAHALSRRGAAGCCARAAAARRAELELPLPAHHSAAGRARPSRAGAGPDRLRPLRQAGRANGLHLRAPCRLDQRLADVARSEAHHAVLPGLGRSDRAAAGRALSRTGSPASLPPTPACRSAAARRRCRSGSGLPSASACRGCRSAG